MTVKWKRANKTEKNKRTEIEQYDWFVERIQTLVAFDWLSEHSDKKISHARELSRNQSILRFDHDVMLQHHWPIEGCLLHIRVFFGEKTKSPCFDLFIHWLIKQIMNSCRNHFSRSYDYRFNAMDSGFQVLDSVFFVSETRTPDSSRSVGFRILELYSGFRNPAFRIPEVEIFRIRIPQAKILPDWPT